MGKSSFSRVSLTLIVVLVALQAARASLLVPWPYLQVYPPVNESDDRTPLYFALMLSLGGQYTSIGALPGVQIALDYINSQPDILPEYSLHYTLTDSQCNRTTAVSAFFRQMLPGPTKVGWVGSGCSVATEPTAELTQFYNITQLSCVTGSPELSNRQRFRYYYQFLADVTVLARGYFAVIKNFDWKKVAIITQNVNLFSVMMNDLKKRLTEYDIKYTETLFTNSDDIADLGPEPFDPEARIYVLAMYAYHARPFICEAHKRGLRYPKHLLILIGWYAEGWLIETNPARNLGCTVEERARTLEYSLAVAVVQFSTNTSLVTEGGLSGAQFGEEYWERINSPINADLNLTKLPYFPYSEHCHEATLALAFALHNTSQDFQQNQSLNMAAAQEAGLPPGKNFTLANFSYVNSVVVERMFHHLKSPGFLGISGNKVTFDENGIRQFDTLLAFQFLPGQRNGTPQTKDVGMISEQDLLFNYTEDITLNEIWPDGTPNDGIPIEDTITIAIPLNVVYTILATAGLSFAVTCLVFNFTFRKTKLLQLSSPKLNYIIGIGAVILYMNVIFLVVPTLEPVLIAVLCNLNPCLTALGFSLCYGTILMKMIRVWYIFNNPALHKKIVFRDWHLSVAVLCLVIADVLILGVYFLVEGVSGRLGTELTLSREHPRDEIGPTAEVHLFFIHVCQSHGRNALFAVLYGYKGLLQVTALILAFRTRKVKVKGLDDSKYIAASIYITSIVLAVIIVATYTLTDYVNVFPTVLGTGFLLGTTMILVLVFVPRMVGLYKDPNGEKIAVSASIPARESSLELHPGEEVKGLRRRITELERSLRHYEQMPQTTPISTDSVSGSKVKFTIAENDMEHDQGGMKHGQNNGLSMRPQNEVREVISTRL